MKRSLYNQRSQWIVWKGDCRGLQARRLQTASSRPQWCQPNKSTAWLRSPDPSTSSVESPILFHPRPFSVAIAIHTVNLSSRQSSRSFPQASLSQLGIEKWECGWASGCEGCQYLHFFQDLPELLHDLRRKAQQYIDALALLAVRQEQDDLLVWQNNWPRLRRLPPSEITSLERQLRPRCDHHRSRHAGHRMRLFIVVDSGPHITVHNTINTAIARINSLFHNCSMFNPWLIHCETQNNLEQWKTQLTRHQTFILLEHSKETHYQKWLTPSEMSLTLQKTIYQPASFKQNFTNVVFAKPFLYGARTVYGRGLL